MNRPGQDEVPPLPEDEEWWGMRVRRDHVLLGRGGRAAVGFGDAGYRAMLRRPGVAAGRSGAGAAPPPEPSEEGG
jgi:hypothetical protein